MWVFSLFAAALECGAAKRFLLFAPASVNARANVVLTVAP
jgi:hypothetical protein